MRAFLLGSGLAALAFAAAHAVPIDSFTPESAGQYAAERAPEAGQAQTALMAAERLRAGLVLNPQGFIAVLSPDEQAALAGAFGAIGDREATHLAWYFRGAIVRRLPGGGGAVLFYSPIADVAAMTNWRRIDGVWRLTQARLIRGEALRSPDDGYWADQTDVAYREAIRLRARAVLASSREYRRNDGPATGFETLRQRSNRIQVGLAAWIASPDRATASRRIRQSLAAAQNPAPEGPTGDQLQALSPDIRRTLALTAVFRRMDGDSLAFVSPLQPGLLIFVDLDAAHRPLRTGAVNLANLQD